MDNLTDQAKWEQLVQQVKEVEKTFDEKVLKKVVNSIFNRELTYFLAISAKDDKKIDDNEFDLIDWLDNDLYKTKDEEYANRIINMMR